MATQVKGVRANKPNDSFGVTNNENLYRGKYREDVYKDEEEQTEENLNALRSSKFADATIWDALYDHQTPVRLLLQKNDMLVFVLLMLLHENYIGIY